MGWQYAIGWLITLPFEITAAGLTISYWHEYNIGIWIAVFLFTLIVVQFFGVKGYGEVEFVLGMIKVIAVLGFVSLRPQRPLSSGSNSEITDYLRHHSQLWRGAN
jgi:amino acid transporter